MEQASQPYASLITLRQAHRQLLTRRREGINDAFLAAVQQFIQRGSAAGALLEADDDRWEAQNLLDFWANELLHNERHAPEATLAEFDPAHLPPLPDNRCPYPGLETFTNQDRPFFFGRDALIETMIHQLANGRFLAIIGPSGSGKSSAALAGLLPRLQSGALPGSDRWRYLPVLRPGPAPLQNLARLIQPAGGPTAITHAAATLQKEPSLLAQRLNTTTKHPTVLVIDQFEELFTLCRDEAIRHSFIDVLIHLQNAAQPHILILTMRSDLDYHLARTAEFHRLYTQNQVRLTALTAAGLRDAIEKPAAVVGLQFADGLVDELVRDILGEPSALPLLQFTLRELWERREGNRITWDAYRQLGGGRQALARSADALYNALTPAEQATARRILLRIVRPGRGQDVNRDRVLRRTLHELPDDPLQIDNVLNKFVEARLVRLIHGHSPSFDQAELAHEALVTNWPRLVGWLDEARVAQRQRIQFSGMADQWEMMQRDPSTLLRGRLLSEAQQYTGLSETEQAFVAASVQAEEEANRQTEAIRQQRIQQAEALAAERQHRLEEKERLNRRLSGLALALGLVFLVAVAAGLLAARNAATARDNAATAVASEATAVASEATAVANEAVAEALRKTAVFNADQLATAEANARAERDAAETNAQEAFEARATAVAGARETARQFRLASARELAAAALDQIGSNTQLGLLLALEAVYVTLQAGEPVPAEATDSLYRALQASQLRRTLSAHTDWVSDVAVSSDGSRIASAGLDRTVRIWDTANGQLLHTLTGHSDAVNSVAFTPDGTRLASGSADGLVLVWNVADGVLLSALEGVDDGGVNGVAFHPDGERLAAVYANATVRIWNATTRRPLLRLFNHTAAVNGVAFHPDGAQFATAGSDGRILVWDLAGGVPLYSLGGPVEGQTPTRINDLAYSPNGDRLAAAYNDGALRIWEERRLARTLPAHVSFAFDVSFSHDGRLLATAGSDGTAKVWEVVTGRLAYAVSAHAGGVTAVQFAPDDILVTASQDNTVKVWNAAPGIAPLVLSAHSAPVRAAAVSSDGRFIATGSEDESVIVWDANSGQPLQTLTGHFETITALAFSPHGAWLASSSLGNSVRLWPLDEADSVRLLTHQGAVNDVTFSPNGALLATAAADGVWLWDVTSTAVITRLAHTEAITAVAFHPDGVRLAAGTPQGELLMWTVDDGAVVRRFEAVSGTINDVAFSPDGTLLAAAGSDGAVTIWLLAAGTARTLRGHSGPVLGVAFHPEEPWLASSGTDRSVRLWDLATGQTLRTFGGHSSTVTAVAFSPDKIHLVSASFDRTALVNTLASVTELFAQAWEQAAAPMTPEACRQFLRGRPCITTQIPGPLPISFSPAGP